MTSDVSLFVEQTSDLGSAGLFVGNSAPPEVSVQLATQPARALGNARQSRLNAELLGALGTGQGAAHPRYRRGVQGLPGA